MGKKKQKITCPSCQTTQWRGWAGSHCSSCGSPYAGPPANGSGGKGTGKGQKEQGQDKPGNSARPKPAAGFKFATPEILEPLSDHLQAFLRVVEGAKDSDALLAAAAPCPELGEAAIALAELRWPATSPDKECQRELTSAQQKEREAEKALGDAKAATAKARLQLTEAEATEAKAATLFEEAKVKAANLAIKLGALKGAETPADVAMAPSTVLLETELGSVRKMIETKELKLKADAARLELHSAKAAGKGKPSGSDSRAEAEPYTTTATEGEKETWVGKDLRGLVEDGTKQTAAAKEALTTLESLQKQMNSALAQVKLLASVDVDL